jgi:RND family efflux transporter MFP subunit
MSPTRPALAKTLLYSLLLLLLAVAGFWALLSRRGGAPMQPPPSPGRPVEIQLAVWEPVVTDIRALGRLHSASAFDLTAQVGGELLACAGAHGIKPGLRLGRGDLICRIDTTDTALDLRRLQAQVRLAEEQHRLALETLDLSRRELDRLEQLLAAGNASEAAVEQARRSWLAQAEREAALRTQIGPEGSLSAQRDLARVRLERCELRAPFDLEILDGELVVGAYVNPGQRIARVANLEELELRLPLRVEEARWLPAPGPAARVSLHPAGGEPSAAWSGRLLQLGESVDPATQTRQALVGVAGGQDGLLPGMLVEAVLEGRTIPAGLVIPRRALREDGRVLVWRAGRLAIEDCEVIFSDRTRAVLSAGPDEGDTLVVSPIPDAVPGMRLALRAATGGKGTGGTGGAR